MANPDIEITTEDTLELDAIIKAWNAKSNSVVDVTDGTEGTDFNLEGIQTNTAIFDPINPGTYNINVNGQELTINVTEGSSIPDSAIHHWKFGEGSGLTATDSIGNVDATIDGPTWTNGKWVENYSINGGSGSVELGTLGNFGSNFGSDFAISLTVKTTGNGRIFFGESSNSSGGTGSDGQRIDINNQQSSGSTIDFYLQDVDTDKIGVEATCSVDDGNPHRYVFNKTANSASGLEIHEDATELSTSINSDQSFNNFKNFDVQPVVLLNELYNGGFQGSPLNGIVDNVLIYNDSLSSAEIQSDYDHQPWI